MRVELSNASRRDLRREFAWVTKHYPQYGRRTVDRVRFAIEGLGEVALHYRVRAELGPAVRLRIVDQYAILYRVLNDAAVVDRVVYAKRDLSRVLAERRADAPKR